MSMKLEKYNPSQELVERVADTLKCMPDDKSKHTIGIYEITRVLQAVNVLHAVTDKVSEVIDVKR